MKVLSLLIGALTLTSAVNCIWNANPGANETECQSPTDFEAGILDGCAPELVPCMFSFTSCDAPCVNKSFADIDPDANFCTLADTTSCQYATCLGKTAPVLAASFACGFVTTENACTATDDKTAEVIAGLEPLRALACDDPVAGVNCTWNGSPGTGQPACETATNYNSTELISDACEPDLYSCVQTFTASQTCDAPCVNTTFPEIPSWETVCRLPKTTACQYVTCQIQVVLPLVGGNTCGVVETENACTATDDGAGAVIAQRGAALKTGGCESAAPTTASTTASTTDASSAPGTVSAGMWSAALGLAVVMVV